MTSAVDPSAGSSQGSRRARWWTLAPWGLRAAAGIGGAIPLAVLYYVFWARLSFPLDLEWMESGMLVHAKRVADGQPLYGPPTVDFASFLYTPLHPWLLGTLGRVAGLSYTLGRALSVLAFTATLGLALKAAWRAASAATLASGAKAPASVAAPASGAAGPGSPPDRVAAATGRGGLDARRGARADALAVFALAAGAVAAAYDWTGGWYDLVRNDSLQVALAVGGLYALAVAGRSGRGVLVGGALLGLAFFAKQTAVFPILAAGLGMLFIRWRLLPLLVAVVGTVAGLGTLWLNHHTDGWFWFYVFELHQSHRTFTEQLWPAAPGHLWDRASGLYLAGLAAALLWGGAALLRRRLPPQGLLWLLAALGGVTAGVVGRATQWSHDNAYIPAVIFPAIFVAVATTEARALLAAGPAAPPARGWRAAVLRHRRLLRGAGWVPAVLLGAHLLQAGVPDIRRHVPDARAWQQAHRLIARLQRLGREGEVYVPYHPWYSVIAGGRGHGHIMNVNDVSFTRRLPPEKKAGWLGDPGQRRERVRAARQKLMRSIRRALGSGRFAVVIHDRALIAGWRRRGARAVPRVDPRYAAQLPGLARRYRLEWDLAWDGASPRTREGNPAAPRYLWRRPRPARPPAGGRVVFDFERTDHGAWEVRGTAFGRGPVSGLLWDPRRRRAQGLVAGAGGRRWVSSFHGGDAATGRLRSPPFVLDRPTLRLRVGGGRQPDRLRVQLEVNGQVVRQATGPGSERFQTVRWDVRPWLGQRARLVARDRASGGWGHLQLDEVWLVPR
jgi:hypothetical protein